MGTRSLQASQKGIEKAKIALAQYSLSQKALAKDLGLSRSTVDNFFKKTPIDRENFALICDRLGLDLENTVAISSVEASYNNPMDGSELDALVQEVRQKVHANIQKRCGEMRVLDMTRPIDLDTIYTDVNILQDITGRRRLDLAELLKHCSLEEFDRLGFAHTQRERRSGLEAVEEFDKLMLLGKPGAGKTTFLKRLATLCSSATFQETKRSIGKSGSLNALLGLFNSGNTFQAHRVPLFITLKDFGDSAINPKLLTYISEWFNELGLQELRKVEQILNQGRAFLLLDGLDEVSESTSKQVLREIQSFSDRFPKNAFVVSCRIAAKEFTFQQFTEVEISDFNDEQIAIFATRWFKAKQLADKADKFLEKLKGHPRIKELATNPLLLTLLCLVFEGRTDFPANRSELYKEGLDVLLKKWDGSRSIEREQVYRELSLKRKEDLLSQLAYTTFEPGNYFFKQKDAERLIEAYIQNLPGAKSDPEALRLDSEAVLKSIEAQHGLLVERARGIYSFSHLTFHEYFTAYRIERRQELYPVLISHLTEKRWREVFLITVGMLEKADALLLLIKFQIDQMLAFDKKFQQFLTWLNQKSNSVNTHYKTAAIRAFYFDLTLEQDKQLTELDLNIILDLALTLTHTLYLDLNLILDKATDLDLDFTLARVIDLDFAFKHNHARYYTRAFERGFDFNFNRIIACDFELILNFLLDRLLDIKSYPILSNLIQRFKEQCPHSDEDWDQFNHWWQMNGLAWTDHLRTAMIEHRNIGYDWQFSDTQKQLRRQYYNANKLLVDCLNSECYVSREVRQEIEESLLLPIAEIEQQFPNQCHREPC